MVVTLAANQLRIPETGDGFNALAQGFGFGRQVAEDRRRRNALSRFGGRLFSGDPNERRGALAGLTQAGMGDLAISAEQLRLAQESGAREAEAIGLKRGKAQRETDLRNQEAFASVAEEAIRVGQSAPDVFPQFYNAIVEDLREGGRDVSEFPAADDPRALPFLQFEAAKARGAAGKLRDPSKPGRPIEVFDPNSPTGTSFVTQTEAVGRPGKPPTGLEITTPGGTTIRTRVRGTGGLQKPTLNKLEADLNNTQAELQRVTQFVSQSFRPEFLTLPTQLFVEGAAGLERLGIETSPEARQQIADFATFKSDVLDNINVAINRLSGAAVSAEEAKRLRASLPDLKDDPVTFQAKLRRTIRRLQAAETRLLAARDQGFKPFDRGLEEFVFNETGTPGRAAGGATITPGAPPVQFGAGATETPAPDEGEFAGMGPDELRSVDIGKITEKERLEQLMRAFNRAGF